LLCTASTRQAADRERHLATAVHQPWLLNPKPRTSVSPQRRSTSPPRGAATATATVSAVAEPLDVLLEQVREDERVGLTTTSKVACPFGRGVRGREGAPKERG
jgi:hypothetical protein